MGEQRSSISLFLIRCTLKRAQAGPGWELVGTGGEEGERKKKLSCRIQARAVVCYNVLGIRWAGALEGEVTYLNEMEG